MPSSSVAGEGGFCNRLCVTEAHSCSPSPSAGDLDAVVTVYAANFSVTAYVVDRTILPGASTSTITLAYTIPYPYGVTQFGTNLLILGPMAGKITGQLLQACGRWYTLC